MVCSINVNKVKSIDPVVQVLFTVTDFYADLVYQLLREGYEVTNYDSGVVSSFSPISFCLICFDSLLLLDIHLGLLFILGEFTLFHYVWFLFVLDNLPYPEVCFIEVAMIMAAFF